MNYFISEAILSLRPGAQFSIVNEDYSKLEWLEPPTSEGGQSKPSKEELELEAERLQREWASKEYQRQRKPEYPPITEQLDDLFHAGAFSPEMTAKIQAVKDKYPKS